MAALPTHIGRYFIEGLVGTGGMGRIYRAHDPDLRRTVAIKLISTDLVSRAERADYVRRFRREAEAAARCAHPNIVAVYDYALHEGQPFLAMEYVDGPSLRQTLNETPTLDIASALEITAQVLAGLGSAHEQGVVHRDIKPGNILMTADRRVKVGDFGISRLTNTEMTTTSVLETVGTPAYMSPEQCRGEDVDSRSDIFSVGATVFEMVSGARAFPGRNVTEVSRRILRERLPLLPPEVRALAPRLQLVLERAMAKRREDRFQTCAEMASALGQVLLPGGDAGPEPSDTTRIPTAPPVSENAATTPLVYSSPLEPPDTGSGSIFDPDQLQRVEERLMHYVGPIARVLVRRAAQRSRGPDELSSELVLAVRGEAQRERFRREIEAILRTPRRLATAMTATPTGATPSGATPTGERTPSGGTRGSSTTGGSVLPDAELERAQAALAEFIGPIARVLVRRTAAKAATVDALWQGLASHIDAPAKRAAFLKRR